MGSRDRFSGKADEAMDKSHAPGFTAYAMRTAAGKARKIHSYEVIEKLHGGSGLDRHVGLRPDLGRGR